MEPTPGRPLPRTIADMLAATAVARAEQPAMGVIADGRLSWQTWREVHASVESVAERIEAVRGWQPCATGPEAVYAALALDGVVASGEPDGVALTVPTSGTGGAPRRVRLSHQNLVSNTVAVAETIGAGAGSDRIENEEVRLSFLPFHHLYARVCDLYCWVYRGSRLVLAESRETIFRDCGLARPTAINGVPYFFQKAVDVADRRGLSLRDLLGGRVKRCYSGGAALSADLQRRYADAGVPLLNGYGLSEASPVVTVSTAAANKPGTVGKPLPGVDVRIGEDGEVLVRGPNVMLGYETQGEPAATGGGRLDEAATAEVIRDGWLHTGDLGRLDADGYLTIVGRKKDLIALATGKKVAPSRVEARLAASPWIEQVAVVGEGRPCLGALIVPNPDRVRAEVRRRRLWVWSKRRALAHPAIRSVFEKEIAACLAGAEREEQVRCFELLGRAFDANRGEITEKLSLRRAAIEQTLREPIEGMFARHTHRSRPLAATNA